MAMYEITSEQTPLDFECTMEKNIIERTIRNAKNLLMCRRGEIPFDRQRGINQAVFDVPLYQAQQMIAAEMDRVMLWEPDAEVVTAWVERDAGGETVVHCVIEIAIGE